MSWPLFKKVLRDLRWPWLGTGLLLMLFEALWVKITDRVTNEVLPAVTKLIPLPNLKAIIFEGPGRFLQAILGGESIDISRSADLLSVGYVHPLPQTILLIWALGRAGGAIAGEIERGTMELLVAQPIARRRIVQTHLCVDLVTIPALALCMGLGTLVGVWATGMANVDVAIYWRGVVLAAALAFSLTGITIAISSAGRSRWRVLAWAIAIALIMSLWNLLGQLWDTITPYRPWSLLYYYQPQVALLSDKWIVAVGPAAVPMLPVLLGVGVLGYLFAIWEFSRRDLPAPL
jgi:ABC-2 type transport system permease protein